MNKYEPFYIHPPLKNNYKIHIFLWISNIHTDLEFS